MGMGCFEPNEGIQIKCDQFPVRLCEETRVEHYHLTKGRLLNYTPRFLNRSFVVSSRFNRPPNSLRLGPSTPSENNPQKIPTTLASYRARSRGIWHPSWETCMMSLLPRSVTRFLTQMVRDSLYHNDVVETYAPAPAFRVGRSQDRGESFEDCVPDH